MEKPIYFSLLAKLLDKSEFTLKIAIFRLAFRVNNLKFAEFCPFLSNFEPKDEFCLIFTFSGKKMGVFLYITNMVGSVMKMPVNKLVFTERKYRVILRRVGSSHRFSSKQRCILPTITDFPAGVPTQLLGDYFPCLDFIPKNNVYNLDILNYIVPQNGNYTLDLEAMSHSNQNSIASLIHEDIALWDEHRARNKYGCKEVIRFFIDAENDKFLHEFSLLKNAGKANIAKDAVPDMFLDQLGYDDGRSIWEEWDFSKLVLHKPSTIYKAFLYYAHKKYTLLGFGLRKLCAEHQTEPKSFSMSELLLAGMKLLDETVMEQIPEMAGFGTERLIAFFQMEQEVLESVSAGSSIYAPIEMDVFIRQLKNRMPGFLKNKYLDSPDQVNFTETYDPGERINIKNHMNKIGQYIDDEKDYSEYRMLKLGGTYREKVNFLYRQIQKPSVRDHYSGAEMINGLFIKQFQSGSMDEEVFGDEGEGSVTNHDITPDEKYMETAERLAWSAPFENEFKHELNESELEKFLKHIPEHFDRYPFAFDDEGNLKMTRYSERMLFSTYCSITGIEEDDEIKAQFVISIRRVIAHINNIRKGLKE